MRQFRFFAASFISVGLAFSTLLGFAATMASSDPTRTRARAPAYCTSVDHPFDCVVRSGAVLRLRPVAHAHTTAFAPAEKD